MLMKGDKKHSVSLIMGKMLGDKSAQPEEMPSTDGIEDDSSMAVDTAASELAQALESKSPKRIAEAFKAMLEIVEAGDSSEASEPQPE